MDLSLESIITRDICSCITPWLLINANLEFVLFLSNRAALEQVTYQIVLEFLMVEDPDGSCDRVGGVGLWANGICDKLVLDKWWS